MEGFEKSPRKGKKKEGEKVTEERGTDGEKGDSGEEEFDSENSSICANSELSNISEESLPSDMSEEEVARKVRKDLSLSFLINSFTTQAFHLARQ